MKWFVYTRGTIHLHRAAQIFLGIHQFAAKLNGIRFARALYINEGPKLWWAWNEKEIKDLGRKILKECRTKKGAVRHFRKLRIFAKQAISAAEKIRKLDLTKISNLQMIRLYDFLCQKAIPAHGLMDSDIDAIDVVFEDFLQNKIKSELMGKVSDQEFADLCRKIFIPMHETFLAEQEKKFMELALKREIGAKDIEKVHEKFWWTKLGWESITPHKKADFLKLIKKYKKDKELENKLAEINSRLEVTKKQRQFLVKKYHLSKEISYWLKIFDEYAYIHDVRKEMQVRTIYSFYLLMSEAARRLKLNKNDLEWLWYDEVQDLLRGKKFDKLEVERRKRAICVKVDKSGVKTWSGKEAIAQHQKELKTDDTKSVKEFKGVGVAGGKVKAKVRVCAGAKEAFKKIKEGDILVCGMTLPDYLPAMKRATAIITDEGGITCHAAIVSRELGIPCVIGTKIATKVLKDGQLVEVDATKGIVRIIK